MYDDLMALGDLGDLDISLTLPDLIGGASGGALPAAASSDQYPPAQYADVPEVVQLFAAARSAYPNDGASQTAYLLTHGPGFSGNWDTWIAAQRRSPMPKQASFVRSPFTSSLAMRPSASASSALRAPGAVPATTADGTTPTATAQPAAMSTTVKVAIGGGVALALGAGLWLLLK